MVWYSHLLQNFPQFIVIHTAEGFGIVNNAEIDVFLELSCFFDDPVDTDNLISVVRVVSSVYLRLLIFLLAILIPACESSCPEFSMMYSAYKLNKQGDNIQS